MNILMRPIEVLLVECLPEDVQATRVALLRSKVLNNLKVVVDGNEALNYLRGEGEYKDVLYPDIIFMGLNIPKLDGRELIKQIKRDSKLKDIPTVVITYSEDREDFVNAVESGADFYLKKPIQINQFLEILQAVNNFWLTYVKVE